MQAVEIHLTENSKSVAERSEAKRDHQQEPAQQPILINRIEEANNESGARSLVLNQDQQDVVIEINNVEDSEKESSSLDFAEQEKVA